MPASKTIRASGVVAEPLTKPEVTLSGCGLASLISRESSLNRAQRSNPPWASAFYNSSVVILSRSLAYYDITLGVQTALSNLCQTLCPPLQSSAPPSLIYISCELALWHLYNRRDKPKRSQEYRRSPTAT